MTATTNTQDQATEYHFQAQVSEVLSLVINSLYSNKEIFLRELLSNASDALDKQRVAALTDTESAGDELRIRIALDEEAGTIAISDNGIGMSAEELVKNLGTVAHSGTRQFLTELKEKKDINLIGQFGVGFYSAYLVADKVTVTSRAGTEDQAHVWESDAKETFQVRPGERDSRGTTVLLHLKEDQREFLSTWKVRELVRRYSDYIGHPIELEVEKNVGEGDDKRKEKSWDVINQARALWQRPPKEISDEQYEEFYKHLSHDWEGPLAHKHFTIEGTLLFTGLLFVPKRPPFGLFNAETKHGVRLHVKRVFIMDDCEDLLPKWLRFIRGVVDSDDLPLNVSRELLQDSHVVRTIQKQVTKQSLDMLEAMAKDSPEDYATFWKNYGSVLKEGLHYDPQYKERLAKLVRYASSTGEDMVSLDTYVDRMKDEQPAIYYAQGTSNAVLQASPHLEALKKREYEVLYMTDPIDQWAVSGLTEYRDKPLASATNADLKLDKEDDDKSDGDSGDKKVDDDKVPAELKPFLAHIRAVLQDKVEKVRVSTRLTDSPVCLVIPDGGLQPHIERMLRAQNADVPESKRIMEINVDHDLITHLRDVHSRDADSAQLREWVEVLYEQALLAEGSPVNNPVLMASRLTKLLQAAVRASVS